MSEALSHALEQMNLRLERGLQEAERELVQARERAWILEGIIRTIRDALERAAAEPDVVTIPHATDDPKGGDAPPNRGDGRTREEGGAPIAAYMPMLEELWEIARREGEPPAHR